MAEYAKLHMKLETVTGIAIDGESEISGFEKQIELADWSWNLSRDPDLKGAVVPAPFRFSKRMDRSTTAMLSAMTKGTLMRAEITLTEMISKAAKRNDGFHMVVYLDNVRVLKYDLDGDGGGSSGELKERWDFNYEKLRFRYRKPGGTGVIDVDLRRKPGDSTEFPSDGKDAAVKYVKDNKNKSGAIKDMLQSGGFDLKDLQ